MMKYVTLWYDVYKKETTLYLHFLNTSRPISTYVHEETYQLYKDRLLYLIFNFLQS